MLVIIVHIHVKPESVAAFKTATIDNASNSAREPGVVRFDFFQQADDPTRFTLVEVYREQAGIEAHKASAHYARWRDAVPDMMAEPRTGLKYVNVFPDDGGW